MNQLQQLEQAIEESESNLDRFVQETYAAAKKEYGRLRSELNANKEALRIYHRRQKQNQALATLKGSDSDDLLSLIASDAQGSLRDFRFFSKTGRRLAQIHRVDLSMTIDGAEGLSLREKRKLVATQLGGIDIFVAWSGHVARFALGNLLEIRQAIERKATLQEKMLVTYTNSGRMYNLPLSEIYAYRKED
jgi:hypothetical protein